MMTVSKAEPRRADPPCDLAVQERCLAAHIKSCLNGFLFLVGGVLSSRRGGTGQTRGSAGRTANEQPIRVGELDVGSDDMTW